jgi:hypothetical protein
MLPKWHFLYGYVFSLCLVYFFNFSLFAGLIIFLSSVFIDLDHVLIYFIKTKNLNPRKFYSWSIDRKAVWMNLTLSQKSIFKRPQFLLHGIEFILILILLSFLHQFFFWILLGVLFHLFLDFLVLIYEREHCSIKASQIWLWQRNKNRKEFVIE